jgi:hypothetical protein
MTIKVFLHLKWDVSDEISYTCPGGISTPRETLHSCSRAPLTRVLPFLSSHRSASMCIECVPPELLKLTPQDHDRFFRFVGGRRCNNLNPSYVMPADEDELRVRCLRINDNVDACDDEIKSTRPQRFELFHRMIRFVFGNKIYVGPVEKVLSPDRDTGGEKLRVLDVGTGGGLW